MKIRGILSVFLIVSAVFSLSCCTKKEEEQTRDLTEYNELSYDDNVIEEDTLLICKAFMCVGAPPAVLPRTAHKGEYGSYVCENYRRTDYKRYIETLKNDGYKAVETKYDDAFFTRNDSFIFLNYYENDKKLDITWYKKSPYDPDGGISADEAEKLLCYEKSLSKIKLHPIDITPKGFFERTGAQIFAVPEYSYDVFAGNGQDELMFEDNEYYDCNIKLVKDGSVYSVNYDCIAVTDIDVDGKEDICFLQYGPTSGLFTFVVGVISDKDVYGGFFNTEHYSLSFVNINKRVYIRGITQDNEYHFFKIKPETNDKERYIELYENDEPVSQWPQSKTKKPDF